MPRYPTRNRKEPKRLCNEAAFRYPDMCRKSKICRCITPSYYQYLHLEPEYGKKFDEDRFKSSLRCKKCSYPPDLNKPFPWIVQS